MSLKPSGKGTLARESVVLDDDVIESVSLWLSSSDIEWFAKEGVKDCRVLCLLIPFYSDYQEWFLDPGRVTSWLRQSHTITVISLHYSHEDQLSILCEKGQMIPCEKNICKLPL